MSSLKRGIARLGLEVSYFAGLAGVLKPRFSGIGVILKFEHVRPLKPQQIDRARVISPQLFHRLLGSLRLWDYDIVSLDDMVSRMNETRTSAQSRRFVCLTFDGGYRDFLTNAYPALERHHAPFSLFVASDAPDGLADLWWMPLERIVQDNSRVGLVMEGTERHFQVPDMRSKRELFDMLSNWLRSLPQITRAETVGELCARYNIDARALYRDQCMSWPELNELGKSPLATLGTSTVSYPLLARTMNDTAEREMANGRTVLEAALNRPVQYFAYPFGDARSFGLRHKIIASNLGFTAAFTSEGGVLPSFGADLHALPRLAWNGRQPSLRLLRVMMSGVTLARNTKKQKAG